MMKAALRELQIDLKVAVELGDTALLEAVIPHLRNMPREGLIPGDLIPLGSVLRPLSVPDLTPWILDTDPILRALAGIALSQKLLRGEATPIDALLALSGDPSPEVRQTLSISLTNEMKGPKSKVYRDLTVRCFRSERPATLALGLDLLPSVASQMNSTQWVDWLYPLDQLTDRGFQKRLLACLGALAGSGFARQVLGVIQSWASRDDPKTWLVTRAVSTSWVRAFPGEAGEILDHLENSVGEIRPILRARASLVLGEE